MNCDFFKLTETKGEGTGESFTQFPLQAGDYIIADRGYCQARGIHYVTSSQAHVTVRLNTQTLRIVDRSKGRFALLDSLRTIRSTGQIKSWSVAIAEDDNKYVEGRICAIRKTEEAIRLAHKKLKRRATRKGNQLKAETLDYAEYVIVFTTFPEEVFSAFDVLEWYRIRWQIELVFKRFKQVAQLGHLPKHDDDSAKAWLYGKLFVALITEKLIDHAVSISPWGYLMAKSAAPKPMA